MGVLTLVDPVVGTTTDATLIAANDAAIKAVINGGIDASNFAAGLIFNPNKIQQGGALTGQGLVWDGAKWTPGAGAQKKTTAKIVNTTVAATDLLNGEITIAAGVMGTTGLVRLTTIGDWLQNSGGVAPGPRIQLVLGAVTLLDTNAPSNVSASATRTFFIVTAEIQNLTATTQSCRIRVSYGSPAGTVTTAAFFTTGEGIINSTSNGSVAEGVNTAAVDTTLAQALKLNVINGSASAAYETKLISALVEVL